MMYVCNHCGCSFDEPQRIWGNYLEHFGGWFYEYEYVCPRCKNGGYTIKEDEDEDCFT